MLVVTIRSCIEELIPLGPGQGEIVVCDNSDDKIAKLVHGALPTGYIREGTLKFIRQVTPCLFSARETAARESRGKYILCLDSHMLCPRDGIVNLVDFMDRRASDPTLGFAHAPISWAHQHESRAKHDRDLTQSELGPWGQSYKDERTITWKGMPWICRRDWFLDRDKGLGGYGALAEHRISWGGGDMHIGVKPWLLGFKNWAVPSRPFIHIGPFPKIDIQPGTEGGWLPDNKYRLYSSSGNYPHTFGFLVSCYVLGGMPMIERNKHFLKEKFGKYIDIDKWIPKAIELGTGEKQWLDVHKVMSFEDFLATKPWLQDQLILNGTYAR